MELTMMEKLAECPTCGSRKIKCVRRTWVGKSRGRTYKVPNLQFYECPDCGERVFDPEAVDRIEAHRPSRARALSHKMTV